jgi:uncharacterized membrane protein (UPF0127 family)
MSKTVCVMNRTKGSVLAARVEWAGSLGARTRGLLGRSSLGPDEGMWLEPCQSVHTFFMRFPIDVLFLDAEGTVLSKATLPPWRLSRWERRARSVLELPAGTLEQKRTDVGDKIGVS